VSAQPVLPSGPKPPRETCGPLAETCDHSDSSLSSFPSISPLPGLTSVRQEPQRSLSMNASLPPHLHQKMVERFGPRVLWFLPGLSVKRWITGAMVGSLLLLLGLALWLNFQPFSAGFQLLRTLAQYLPSTLSGPLLMIAGLAVITPSLRKLWGTLSAAVDERGVYGHLAETLYRRNKLSQGPKIVAIGGGTGLSTLLRGLKHYTSNLTAIVTVGDDGGSSGILRTEHGIIPPGDIRNCIAALADEERLITELFQYRFKTGEGLSGHSFGNLFLTALCHITGGDMLQAIQESCKVLNIRGRVLPSTLEQIRLVATFTDGTSVEGESLIPEQHKTIQRLSLLPESPKALPEALEALRQADLIVIGPGSLYTSIIPNLLLPEIIQAIQESGAQTLYVANVVTQPGETDGYTLAEHVNAILTHAHAPHLVKAVLAHPTLSADDMPEQYQKAGSEPVALDVEQLTHQGVSCVVAPLIKDIPERGPLRHDPTQLGAAILNWYLQRD